MPAAVVAQEHHTAGRTRHHHAIALPGHGAPDDLTQRLGVNMRPRERPPAVLLVDQQAPLAAGQTSKAGQGAMVSERVSGYRRPFLAAELMHPAIHADQQAGVHGGKPGR